MAFLCISTNTECFINKVSVWKIGDKYMFNCHDVHNYSEKLNKDQIDKFQEIIPQLDDALLIIENQPISAQEYRSHNLFNTAAEIQDLFLKRSFTIQEADFRQKQSWSSHRCLQSISFDNNRLNDLDKELIERGLTTKAIAREFEDAFNQVKHMIDSVLSQQKISSAMGQMLHQTCENTKLFWGKELEAWKEFDGSLLQYCLKNDCFTQEYLVNSLNFSRHILDIKMFLSVITSDRMMIFVTAGSAHSQTIEYFLKCARATELSSEGKEFPLDGLRLPSDIPVEKVPRYTMTADELYLKTGEQIHPVSAQFFNGLINPEFYKAPSLWSRLISFFV